MTGARGGVPARFPVALAVCLAAAVGCSEAHPPTWDEVAARIARDYPDVPRVTAETLSSWLDDGRPVVLLDARGDEEYRVSHLPGAHHAPDAAAAARVLAAADPGATVVAYCSVGVRSAELARALARRADRQVFNLEGSIFAWANQGRTVVRDGEPVRDVHPYDAAWGALLDPGLRTEVPRDRAAGEPVR